jgi:hypothetical protein
MDAPAIYLARRKTFGEMFNDCPRRSQEKFVKNFTYSAACDGRAQLSSRFPVHREIKSALALVNCNQNSPGNSTDIQSTNQ